MTTETQPAPVTVPGHGLLALAVPRATSRMPAMVRCECGWHAARHGATEAMVRAWHTAHAAHADSGHTTPPRTPENAFRVLREGSGDSEPSESQYADPEETPR